MKLTQKLMLVAIAGILIAGCGSADYKKTKEGLAYKIISDGKGEKIKPGTLIKLHLKRVVGDSTLISTFDHIPAYGKYDTLQQAAYDFIDFLGELKVGDSAVYILSVDTLQKKGQLQYGGIFKKGGNVTGYVKVLSSFKNEGEMSADHDKEVQVEKDREVASLEKLTKDKGLTVQKTKNGVFVYIEKEGTGAIADTGKKVSVKYTGYLLNGKKFDSNTDSTFQHLKPFDFVVGGGQVIPGWDEGIRSFKVGSVGKLYIPAMLGWGPQSQGDRIPGYSNVIFDIEVLDVQDAPKVPGQFQTPGAIPPQ
jgi:FKBP-type peptidyl-prolyl cis-trans isomerase